LLRPTEGRVVAGVAVGVAAHLGLPVRAVRIALVASGFAGGAGVVLYLWLWALVRTGEGHAADLQQAPRSPVGSSASLAGPPPVPAAPTEAVRARARRTSGRIGDVVIGGLLLLAGFAVLAAQLGWSVQLGLVLPLLVVTGGAVLAYSQLDEVERSRWTQRAGGGGRAAAMRVVGGLVLVLLGVLLVVVRTTDIAYAGTVLVAVVAVLGGTALVLAPWGVRLWRDLDAERAARVRDAERADIAAHLHDSVLQTLALIQRHSGDPAQVVRLARSQERDLRGWLYGSRTAGAGTLDGEVRALAEDVEDRYGVAVEVVVVGDRVLDGRGQALVAALREAMVNAVRHAGAPVTVYAESGPDGLEAFVRDRGPGFALDAVPTDRLGVRESIIGRMERHGGTATLRSTPDGTEVTLTLPDPTPPDDPGAPDDPGGPGSPDDPGGPDAADRAGDPVGVDVPGATVGDHSAGAVPPTEETS
jgi:signal transduction histidine kinase/phage shock protein PspC (stress-responsive transcriptional regulator)